MWPFEEFRQTLDQLYSVNYAAGALVEADSTRRNPLYKASHLTDGDERPVGPSDDAKTGSFVLDLGKEQHFDVVELKETIEKGQQISGFTIDVAVNGQWVPLGWLNRGYRRLIKGNQLIVAISGVHHRCPSYSNLERVSVIRRQPVLKKRWLSAWF